MGIGKSAAQQEAEKKQQEKDKISAQKYHQKRMNKPQAGFLGLTGKNVPARAPTLFSTKMK